MPGGPTSVSRRWSFEQRHGVGQLLLAADERSRLHRQVRPVERLQRREVLGAELEEPLRLEEVLEAVLAQVAYVDVDELAGWL